MNNYELHPQWRAYLKIAPGTSLLILQFLYVAYFVYASILILNHHFALSLKISLLAPLIASFILPTAFSTEHTLLQLADLFGSLGFLLLNVIFVYKTKQSGRKHFLVCMLSDLYSMINELGLLEFLLVVWKRYHLTTQIICYWMVNLATAFAITYPSSYFDFIYCISTTSFSSLCNIIGLTLFLNRSFHRLLTYLNHWALSLHPRLTEAPADITNDSTGLYYDSSTSKNAPFFFGWFEFAVAMSLSSSFHQSPNKNLRISHLYTVVLTAFSAFLELGSETFEGRLQNSTQREPLSQQMLTYFWQIIQLYWNFLLYGLLLLFLLPLGLGIALIRLFHLDYLSSSTDISHFIVLVLIVSLFLIAAKTAFHIVPKIFVHASGGELAELDLDFCVRAYRNSWGPVMTTNFIAKNRSLLLFSTAFLYVFLEIMVHTFLFVSLVIGQYLDSEVEVDHETHKSTSVSKLVNIEPIDFVFLPLYAHLKIWVGIERLCTLWRDFSAARTRFAALQPLCPKELDIIFEAGCDEGSLCAICYSSYLATSDYTFNKSSTIIYTKGSSMKLEKCLKNLVDETIRKTPCQHIFHANCIRRWLYFKPCCPLCIQPIGVVAPPPSNANDLAAVLARSSQERFYTTTNRNTRVHIRGRELRVRKFSSLSDHKLQLFCCCA
ncbi:hypothetical protein Ciccas_000669 [Cichlidogyrus casuarinus]|uniref:RING-type domain-containing protein n=1 Tax=Cichlidogyrus casuarinus TaxID=1844966 RepID=A0ABD2QNB5_9PLAT